MRSLSPDAFLERHTITVVNLSTTRPTLLLAFCPHVRLSSFSLIPRPLHLTCHTSPRAPLLVGNFGHPLRSRTRHLISRLPRPLSFHPRNCLSSNYRVLTPIYHRNAITFKSLARSVRLLIITALRRLDCDMADLPLWTTNWHISNLSHRLRLS